MSLAPVSSVPKGYGAARFALALLQVKGEKMGAVPYARNNYRDTPWVADALQKSLVAPGTSTDGSFAGPLTPVEISADFIPLLRTQEVLQRATGFRVVPLNTEVPRITIGTVATFIGEGSTVPLTRASFDTFGPLPARCVFVDVPVTTELLRLSRPGAEKVLLFDMLGAAGFASDLVFLNRLNAGSASQPASIAYGGLTVASTGGSAIQVGNDIASAVSLMAANGSNFASPYICMNPALLAKLACMRTTTGAPAFGDLTVKGGSIAGIPALPTAGLTMQSGDASDICIFDAALIAVADEGDMGLTVATQATVQLATDPDDPVNAGTVQTSLWQSNLCVLRHYRYRNFARTNDAACVTITNVPS